MKMLRMSVIRRSVAIQYYRPPACLSTALMVRSNRSKCQYKER